MRDWTPDSWFTPDAEQLASLQRLADRVQDQVGTLRSSRSSSLPTHFPFMFGDASVAMAITAERGGGKSTLLSLVTQKLLAGRRDVVIPTLRPEFFAANDSVVSATLSWLWAYLTLDVSIVGEGPLWLTELDGDARNDLAVLCMRAERSYAQAQTSTATLENAARDAASFAENSVSVSRSALRAQTDVANLVARVLGAAPGEPSALLVVPIDDADLAPGQIARMLGDLRFLGTVPGVVPIACFDVDDLRREWLAARDSTATEARLQHLSERLERELEKIFPSRFRFAVPPLSVSARRSFTPIGETLALAEAWKQFSLELEEHLGHRTSLNKVLSADRLPTGLTSPLPSTPRSLVQLWESLRPVVALRALRAEVADVSDAQARNTLEVATARFLDIASAPLRFWCRDVGLADPSFGVAYGDDSLDGAMNISVVLPEASIGISTSESFDDSEFTSGHPRIDLRPLSRIYVDARIPVESGESVPRKVRMSESAAAAYLVLQEFTMEASNLTSLTTYVGADEWRFLQQARMEGAGDHNPLLLTLPCGRTLSEVVDLFTAWRRLEAKAGTAPSIVGLLTEGIREAVNFAALDVDPSGAPTAVDGTYESELSAAAASFVNARRFLDSRSTAFCSWFEELLPLQWHSAVWTDDEFVRNVGIWREAISGRSPTSASGRAVGLDTFDRVVRTFANRTTPPEWVSGYAAVAAAKGSRLTARLTGVAPSPFATMRSLDVEALRREEPDLSDIPPEEHQVVRAIHAELRLLVQDPTS